MANGDWLKDYPAVEGIGTRTGYVDFVTSDNPHCGKWTHARTYAGVLALRYTSKVRAITGCTSERSARNAF